MINTSDEPFFVYIWPLTICHDFIGLAFTLNFQHPLLYLTINYNTHLKKTWTITSSTFSRYRQTPKLLWTSNVPTLRAGIHLYSCSFLLFGDFGKQDWKADAIPLCRLYFYLSIGVSVLMLHINIIYGFNYPNAKGCDTSKRRPRALRILRNIPAPGSTLPFSMREIYDLLVPTRWANSCCVTF